MAPVGPGLAVNPHSTARPARGDCRCRNGIRRLGLHLHPDEVQRLVVEVLDRVRRFRLLVDHHRQFRRGRQRPGIEQNLALGTVIDVGAGFGDVQDARPAMRVERFPGMRRDRFAALLVEVEQENSK